MSIEPQGRQASEDEINEVAAVAQPFIDAFMGLPGQLGLHALCWP